MKYFCKIDDATASECRSRKSLPLLWRLSSFAVLALCIQKTEASTHAPSAFVTSGNANRQTPLLYTRTDIRTPATTTTARHAGPLHHRETLKEVNPPTRAEFLRLSILCPAIASLLPPSAALALTGQVKTSQYAGKTAAATKTTKDPKKAFANLLSAREELVKAKSFLYKGDVEGMVEFVREDAKNSAQLEGNMLVILSSKMMSDEDKKEIGTIRRYGVGADVVMMYGGVLTEIEMSDYPDAGSCAKFLQRTIDALDEVIAICRNNGF